MQTNTSTTENANRKSALGQAAFEKSLYLVHARVAKKLLDATEEDAKAIIFAAKQTVQQWKNTPGSNQDYVSRWSSILDLPARRLAVELVSEMDGWGKVLRHNSPFVRK